VQALPDGDSRKELPEIEWGWHLLNALDAIGYCRKGPEPVDYQEIRAWMELTGAYLTPWEVETLHALSDRYTAQRVNSADPHAPPPFWPIPENVNVDDKLRMLARKKGAKRG